MGRQNKEVSLVLREYLCKKVMMIKRITGFTYGEIIECSGGLVNSSQLTDILKHKGSKVSTDTIFTLIVKLGYGLEVELYNDKIHMNMEFTEEEIQWVEEEVRGREVGVDRL